MATARRNAHGTEERGLPEGGFPRLADSETAERDVDQRDGRMGEIYGESEQGRVNRRGEFVDPAQFADVILGAEAGDLDARQSLARLCLQYAEKLGWPNTRGEFPFRFGWVCFAYAGSIVDVGSEILDMGIAMAKS